MGINFKCDFLCPARGKEKLKAKGNGINRKGQVSWLYAVVFCRWCGSIRGRVCFSLSPIFAVKNRSLKCGWVVLAESLHNYYLNQF
jgi:hypothetical protein